CRRARLVVNLYERTAERSRRTVGLRRLQLEMSADCRRTQIADSTDESNHERIAEREHLAVDEGDWCFAPLVVHDHDLLRFGARTFRLHHDLHGPVRLIRRHKTM